METPRKVGRSRFEDPVPASPSPLVSSSSTPRSVQDVSSTAPPLIDDKQDAPKVGRSRFEKVVPQEVQPKLVAPISAENQVQCCSENCAETLNQLREEERQNLSDSFKCETKLEKRNKLLNHIKAQESLAINTDQFSWKGNRFCNTTFAKAVNSSVFILADVITSNKRGVKQFIHGNQGIAKFSLPRTKFIVWMRGFLSKYAQSAPDNEVQVLNHWLTKAAMYKMYLQETTLPHLAEKTFYEHMKTYFGPHRIDKSLPQVRISKFSSHSVCDQCLAFSNARKCSKTEEELNSVNAMKSSHLKKVSEARQAMEELKQSAIQFPDNSLVIQLDGMDNHKSYTPREQEKSKRTAGLLRLPTKITGCIIYSGHYKENRKVVFYINHDQFEQASNMVISTIFRLLTMFINDHGRLPKKLRVFCDNCWLKG